MEVEEEMAVDWEAEAQEERGKVEMAGEGEVKAEGY